MCPFFVSIFIPKKLLLCFLSKLFSLLTPFLYVCCSVRDVLTPYISMDSHSNGISSMKAFLTPE